MKTGNLLPLTAALAACLLAGCGGSGGGSKSSAVPTGAVRFQIQWPSVPAQPQGKALPSLIPLDAKSIVITIRDGATIISGPTVIAAPAPGAAATATIPNLPLKALTALVEAKVDPAGQGVAETAASEMVTPTSGTPATAPTLVLHSQITKVTISTPPSGIALIVGGIAFLSVTPTNAQGQVVMVDPNTKTIQWTVGPGLVFAAGSASTGLSVQLTGTSAGTSSVSATYRDGSAATGDAVSIASNGGVGVPVVVQALPTGRPPNVPQYVNQAGLAIGPTGTGPGKFQFLSDIALGSLYTADSGNASGNTNGTNGSQLQKYTQDKTTGALSLDKTFGGSGAVEVANATSVAVDSSDDVYVVSGTPPNTTIAKFSPTGGVIPVSALVAGVTNATGIVVDSLNNLFVAEDQISTPTDVTVIEVFDQNGVLVTTIKGLPVLAGKPTGITVDQSENIYVLSNNALVKFKPNNPGDLKKGYVPDGSFGAGGRTTPLVSPARVTVDKRPGLPTSGNLYVTLPQNNQVEVFDKNGNDSGKLPLDIPLSTPTGIAIDNSPPTVPTSGYIYTGNQVILTGTPNVDNAVHVFKPQ